MQGGGHPYRGRTGADGAPKGHSRTGRDTARGKLALISWEKDGEVCCISLINTGRLMGVVQEALSPMMKDMMEVTR